MTIRAKFTIRFEILVLGLLVVLFSVALVEASYTAAQKKESSKEAKAKSNVKQIDRGKYIVEGVAACSDCHTPRLANGESDRTKWLAGAPVFFQPARPVPNWPINAPRLAGLPPGSDADIVKLLTTGIWRDGKPLRLPMPHFWMARSDAEAVVAYLKSL
jgi:hypothetical protein